MRILTALGLVCIMCAFDAPGQTRAPIKVTRLFTGPDGQTHAEITELKMRPYTLHAGLDESEPLGTSGSRLLRWPAGCDWGWHNSTQRQYVTTISGRSEVEVAGGKKLALKPGDIVLAEDTTGKGHVTRCIGSDDLLLLLIPIAAP